MNLRIFKLRSIAEYLRFGSVSRLAFGALAALPGLALAGPAGENVVAGAATIHRPNATHTQIDQSSQNAVVNWSTFSVDSDEYVVFNQPGTTASILNRVVGQQQSSIMGHLEANGRVFLVNPQGVYFAPGAKVDVGALTASVLGTTNNDFMSGNYVFTRPDNAADGATVENAGEIKVGDGGYVVLAGDYASNTGIISARLGSVVLAAGNRMTLDFSDDGLVIFAVDEATVSSLAGANNSGQILADGGHIIMTAKVANDLVATAVNNDGLLQAHRIVENGSEIFLSASGGDIVNAGSIDVAGVAGNSGGRVDLYADGNISLVANSSINANGDGAGNGGVVNVIAEVALAFREDAEITVIAGANGERGSQAGVSFFGTTVNVSGQVDVSADYARVRFVGTTVNVSGGVTVDGGADARFYAGIDSYLGDYRPAAIYGTGGAVFNAPNIAGDVDISGPVSVSGKYALFRISGQNVTVGGAINVAATTAGEAIFFVNAYFAPDLLGTGNGHGYQGDPRGYILFEGGASPDGLVTISGPVDISGGAAASIIAGGEVLIDGAITIFGSNPNPRFLNNSGLNNSSTNAFREGLIPVMTGSMYNHGLSDGAGGTTGLAYAAFLADGSFAEERGIFSPSTSNNPAPFLQFRGRASTLLGVYALNNLRIFGDVNIDGAQDAAAVYIFGNDGVFGHQQVIARNSASLSAGFTEGRTPAFGGGVMPAGNFENFTANQATFGGTVTVQGGQSGAILVDVEDDIRTKGAGLLSADNVLFGVSSNGKTTIQVKTRTQSGTIRNSGLTANVFYDNRAYVGPSTINFTSGTVLKAATFLATDSLFFAGSFTADNLAVGVSAGAVTFLNPVFITGVTPFSPTAPDRNLFTALGAQGLDVPTHGPNVDILARKGININNPFLVSGASPFTKMFTNGDFNISGLATDTNNFLAVFSPITAVRPIIFENESFAPPHGTSAFFNSPTINGLPDTMGTTVVIGELQTGSSRLLSGPVTIGTNNPIDIGNRNMFIITRGPVSGDNLVTANIFEILPVASTSFFRTPIIDDFEQENEEDESVVHDDVGEGEGEGEAVGVSEEADSESMECSA
jgi:filamentous hemagglutinin family protein